MIRKKLQVIAFRVFFFACLNIFALPVKSFSQPVREWRVAFMPNINYAFPYAGSWLNNIKCRNFKIQVVQVADTVAGPAVKMKVDVWIALAGEYDPVKWEPLSTNREKIQIHFWPMTRGKLTKIEEIKDLVSDHARIFYDQNDLLSRTCWTIFDALEAMYEGATVNLVHRQNLNWPPFNEFQKGEKLNTILLPLINYNPNPTLLKVIKYARRQSIDISNDVRVKFCEQLNSRQSAGGHWPLTRISNLFFPGSLPRNFLQLGQRQLWPVQTTAEIVLLVCKKNGNCFTKHDRQLLLKDLKAVCKKLNKDVTAAMNPESQTWQSLEKLSSSAIDSVINSVWQISQKSRWTVLLSQNQLQAANIRKHLRKYIREFSKKSEGIIDPRQRVRFRELDYLVDQEDFWAVNNLVDIYNKVGNHAGAMILARSIIDPDDPDIN